MSSVARGNAFENRVFAALQDEVDAERLGLLPKQCSLFQKKGYFSRDRQSDVIVDISIEVTLPGATEWSMLWVCECKDYSGALPVNDVEEFKAKLDQIAGKNVKGLLAVTGALQSGAEKYARSQGIGVVRIMPPSQVEWLMYFETVVSSGRESLDPAQFQRALTIPGFTSRNREFFGRADGYIFGGWRALLRTSLGGDAS
ncbi:restriction endonuclease [Ramlibacter sp. 2FC]|uniref:restriction endonuclease n=1 Tax=Ramlibacter sp. 2FC TaxID=2502188 RepID=UPI0010FA33D4|nr:restriction endonuclease [Ramlibacter sp. 2FC]